MADLYPDREPRGKRRDAQPRQRPWSIEREWRRVSASLLFHAETLWLRGETVFAAARALDTAMWTDQDREVAMAAVSRAYRNRERGDLLEDVAFTLRLWEISNESRRCAA